METKASYFEYLRYTKSLAWSKYLLEKSIPISDFNVNKKDNLVHIRSADHFFSPGDFPVFFDGYSKYCWKFLDNGFQFVFEQNEMFVKINELTIKVETLEELYIINEVFIENMYRIESKSDYIVFDIGMNVGITSLYFSQFDNIKAIYGFEPFKPTFECANVNVMLNKKYTSKIHLSNVGLSNADKSINLSFDPQNKGNVGIKNVGIYEGDTKQLEQIELKQASTSLQKIINEHPGNKIIVKLDCEGSEYDIIENLESASMLPAFNIFMIEWHKMDGYKSRLNNLIASLKKNGFVVFTIGSFDSEIGMIYALNSYSSNSES